MASFAPASDSDYIPTSSKLPLQELIPYCACICFVTSCYTEFPDCIGCAGKRICLCCYSEFMSCKFSKETEEDIWCHINKGHTYCGSVETCCMVCGDNINYHFHHFNIYFYIYDFSAKSSIVLFGCQMFSTINGRNSCSGHMLLLYGQKLLLLVCVFVFLFVFLFLVLSDSIFFF